VMLWILWFSMAFSYYGMFIWLPALLVGQGYPEVQSFRFTLYITLAQIPGYFTAAWLVERLGRKGTLATFMILCAVASYFFGGAGSPGHLVFLGCLVSFFNLGAWGVTYGYTPELYPTRLRGTGTGAAAAFGRTGGALAPLVVSWLVATGGGGFALIFLVFAGVLATGALAVLLLGEETRGRSLEQISG
jgi:putative MFS transporter